MTDAADLWPAPLHGGLPEYFLQERRPTALEGCLTVAWWEQRGAGLFYSSSVPRTSLTVEQFIWTPSR